MSFLPAVSAEAMKAMGLEIRSGHMAKRSDKSLDDLARMSILWRRGGSTTTDAFTSPGCSTSSVGSTNHLVRWVCRKYKQRLRTENAVRWHGWPRSPCRTVCGWLTSCRWRSRDAGSPCRFGVGDGRIAPARPRGWPGDGGPRWLREPSSGPPSTALNTHVVTDSTVTSTIPAAQRPSVLHIYSLNPLVVDGTNSIIDAWITAAGGRNAAQISGNARPVSTEQVAQWNPDVIILASSAFAAADTGQQTLENLSTDSFWNHLAEAPLGLSDLELCGVTADLTRAGVAIEEETVRAAARGDYSLR